MIQNILRGLASIEHYGVASLCLFSTLFLCVLVWAFLQKKSHLERMAQVPLETEPETLNPGVDSHE